MEDSQYTIIYRGQKYELDSEYWDEEQPNSTREFQLRQLNYCVEVGDFITLENRINNMLKWGGIKKVEK
jgi:hypothetical protein